MKKLKTFSGTVLLLGLCLGMAGSVIAAPNLIRGPKASAPVIDPTAGLSQHSRQRMTLSARKEAAKRLKVRHDQVQQKRHEQRIGQPVPISRATQNQAKNRGGK